MLKNNKNNETRGRTRVFGVKERVEEEMPAGGSCGPQEGVWRGQGLGHTTWPPGPGVDPPGQPQVPPDGFLSGNYILNFLEFSGQLHCREFFKVQKAAKTFVNLRQKLEQVKLLTQKLGYNKENKS